LNLQAETLAQLDAVISEDRIVRYSEGVASEKSRIDYVRERLRLLYVGITRARQELVLTWNTGRRGDNSAALPLIAIAAYSKEQGYGHSE
jgi:DNA helicase-2/ATP-dependent DNA helicase PcrA